VIETTAEAAHHPVDLILAGMAEGRVADIVGQCEGFGEVLINAQNARYSPGNLRNLDRMRQPVAKVIRNPGREHLGFIFQPAERPGMDHAVAITLERIPVRMRQFRIAAAARAFKREAQVRELSRQSSPPNGHA
jgi:hypothetical protein